MGRDEFRRGGAAPAEVPRNSRPPAPRSPARTPRCRWPRSPDAPASAWRRSIAAGRLLLLAAQHAHDVRDDLTLEQVIDMVVAIATIPGDTRYLEPILQTPFDGLRPPTDEEPA